MKVKFCRLHDQDNHIKNYFFMKKTNMYKLIITFALICLTFNSLAFNYINYTISFKGYGASTTIDNVEVQNLTQGTSITVPANNTLNLVTTVTSSAEQIKENENINVLQHPETGIITVSFLAHNEGITQVSIFSVDGRKLATLNQTLAQGINNFNLFLPKGLFVLQIHGMEFRYTKKIINSQVFESKPSISFVGTSNQQRLIQQKTKCDIEGITQMFYRAGDRLRYKAKSGNYTTIVTDTPTTNKIINFDFVSCQDADLNNYTTVTIGTQQWMVENLKTTKYRNGDLIGTTSPATKNISSELTPKYQWAYNGDETNVEKYGRLYTWHVVSDSRNIAPIGWHVPTSAEWGELQAYADNNLGISISFEKALAANTDWSTGGSTNNIGNNLSLNNSTCFSALPGGYRQTTNTNGIFRSIYEEGFWWTTNIYNSIYAYNELLAYGYTVSMTTHLYSYKSYGYSVRCVRDL